MQTEIRMREALNRIISRDEYMPNYFRQVWDVNGTLWATDMNIVGVILPSDKADVSSEENWSKIAHRMVGDCDAKKCKTITKQDAEGLLDRCRKIAGYMNAANEGNKNSVEIKNTVVRMNIGNDRGMGLDVTNLIKLLEFVTSSDDDIVEIYNGNYGGNIVLKSGRAYAATLPID